MTTEILSSAYAGDKKSIARIISLIENQVDLQLRQLRHVVVVFLDARLEFRDRVADRLRRGGFQFLFEFAHERRLLFEQLPVFGADR